MMAELDVGALVIGTAQELAGILTDRDIILRVVVDGRSSADVTVAEVMSSTVFSCAADDLVESALGQMREKQIRRMPVYDEHGLPIGIVTLSDLAKAVDSPEQIKEIVRDLTDPHRVRKTAESDGAAAPAELEPAAAAADSSREPA